MLWMMSPMSPSNFFWTKCVSCLLCILFLAPGIGPSSSQAIIQSSFPFCSVSKLNIDPPSISLFWECDPIPDHRNNKQVVLRRSRGTQALLREDGHLKNEHTIVILNFRQNPNSSVIVPHDRQLCLVKKVINLSLRKRRNRSKAISLLLGQGCRLRMAVHP